MDKLANAIVLTSQGVSFIHSGEEMLRTKKGIANSYNSPDSINNINWSRKAKYKAVFNYYKGLVALRKNHPAFRMPTAAMIQSNLKFLDSPDKGTIIYQIANHANGDSWKNVLVILNGDATEKTVKLPEGKWTLAVDGNRVNEKGISKGNSGEIKVAGTAACVLYRM